MRKTRRLAILLGGIACAAAAPAATVTAIGAGNQLVTVDSGAPGTVLGTTAITGLGTGQRLLDIDARPAFGGRVLYGLSNAGQVYAINPFTGGATAVGTPIAQVAVQGSQPAGIDFNPTVDRLRVVNATGLNLRVNPDTGTVAAYDGSLKTTLSTGTGPDVFGVAGAAYTNNVAGATTTTLYDLNGANGRAYIQSPPNTGQLVLLGLNSATSTNGVGFDIAPVTGQALATFTSAQGVTSLYSVDLQSGFATLIGVFGTSGTYTGLAFTPASFASAAATPNQRAVATAIDGFTGVPSSSLGRLFTGLDTLADNAGRATAFSRLGPNQYSILPDLALQTNEFVDGTIRRYLRDVRGGGTGNTDPGATSGSDRKLGGFLVGSGRTGKFRARGDRDQVDYGATGVLGGLDYRLNEKTLIGVTGGYDHTDARLNPQSPDSDIRNGYGGVYGTIGLGPFYVDFDGTYGKSRYNLRRDVAFGNFSDANVARTHSRYYAGTATAGFSFDVSGFEAEAYGGARYANVHVRAFGEIGGISALTVSRQYVESLQSIAGLRFGADYVIGGAHVRPSIRGEYRHEFDNDDSRLITASFGPGTGISSTPIVYATTPLGKDYAVLGGGLTISGNAPVAVVLDYTGQYFGGYRIHAAQVGLRLSL